MTSEIGGEFDATLVEEAIFLKENLTKEKEVGEILQKAMQERQIEELREAIASARDVHRILFQIIFKIINS